MPVIEPRNSQGLPLFAQTLETQRLRQLPPPKEKFFVPQAVLFALPVLAIGTLLIVARPNIAQTAKNAKASGGAVETVSKTKADGDIALEPAEETGRRPIDFYTGGVRSNMFSPPEPPKPKVIKVAVAKPAPPKKQDPPVKVPVQEVNPFQDWSYTGVITMGESRMALLENTKTKEGQYVKEGETFLGSTVGQITDQSIALSTGGKVQTLAKSDTINVLPLNSAAPPPQPQQPAQPNGMPQMPQGGMMPMMQGGFQGGRFGGMQMSPEQRQQMRAQWMNNNFRGGRNRGN